VEYAATLTEEGLAFGFLRQGTHEVVPITGCAVAHPLNERIRQKAAETLQAVAQGHEEKTSIYKLICRTSVSRNEALVTLVVGHAHPFLSAFASQLMEAMPEVVGVAVARARGPHAPRHSPAAVIAGRKHLVERVGEFDYRVSADAFFQVNPASAGVLVDTALEFAQVTAEDRIVDGYCGVGLFLLPLAARARRGWGLEEDEAALVDARANLRAAHLGNCLLYQGPVERTLPKLSARRRAEVICLDPPRRGCGRTALVGAVAMRPRAIIVVSCEPATLARDLAVLQGLGFRTSRVRPVDLFPHTWHVEAVAQCVPG
jgi:23S rRNA (uracil1939-C5)-methyltransferase